MFPEVSVALYVIVVVPVGNTFPGGTPERVNVTPGQLSLAVAVPSPLSETAPEQTPLKLGGAVTVGGWVSFTVSVKVQVAVFPEASVEVQVIVVVPLGKKEPEA